MIVLSRIWKVLGITVGQALLRKARLQPYGKLSTITEVDHSPSLAIKGSTDLLTVSPSTLKTRVQCLAPKWVFFFFLPIFYLLPG